MPFAWVNFAEVLLFTPQPCDERSRSGNTWCVSLIRSRSKRCSGFCSEYESFFLLMTIYEFSAIRNRSIRCIRNRETSIRRAYLDTVEVWGSSPHEPTTPFLDLLKLAVFSGLQNLDQIFTPVADFVPGMTVGSRPMPRTNSLKRGSSRRGSKMASTFRLIMHGS